MPRLCESHPTGRPLSVERARVSWVRAWAVIVATWYAVLARASNRNHPATIRDSDDNTCYVVAVGI